MSAPSGIYAPAFPSGRPDTMRWHGAVDSGGSGEQREIGGRMACMAAGARRVRCVW